MPPKLTPRNTAKAKCCDCLSLEQFNRNEIQNCKGDTCHAGPCPLFPYRLGKRISVRVFRAFCLQCMCGSIKFVRECETVTCPVHPYRMGKNPSMAGKGHSADKLKEYFQKRPGEGISPPETTISPECRESYTPASAGSHSTLKPSGDNNG